MNKMKELIDNVFYAIRYIWRIDKIYIALVLLNVVLTSFSSIFSIYSLKIILDVFSKKDINELIECLFIVYAIFAFVDYIQSKVQNKWIGLKKIKITKQVDFDIFDSILNKNVLAYDDKEYYDKLYFNISQSLTNLIEFVDNMGTLLSVILSIGGVGFLVLQYDNKIIVLVLGIVLISVVLNFYQSKLEFSKSIDTVYPSRIMEYAKRVVYLKQFAKEIRLFKVFDVIKNQYQDATNNLYSINKKYANKTIRVSLAQSILEMVLQICTILILAFKYILNEIVLSDFFVLYNGSMDLCTYIKSIFNVIPSFYKNSLYVQEFKKLLKQEGVEGYFDKIEIQTLKLENITFSYTDRIILNKFNYVFKKGNIYLLKGTNGAGKSTLLNIICGLYERDDGKIYINGECADTSLLKNNVSIAFQDSQLYALPIINNILMRPVNNEKDERFVCEALNRVGMLEKINRLPLGIYTPFSQELDNNGISFSGGEIQKIIIARLLVNLRSVNIFDEITNSMDDQTKRLTYSILKEIAKTSIVIIVDHNVIEDDMIKAISI